MGDRRAEGVWAWAFAVLVVALLIGGAVRGC
jgi:hypothetical protein